MIAKIISGILGGFIVAVLGLSVVTIALATDTEYGARTAVITFFIFWIAAIIFAIISPGAIKVWRRLLIASAILSFTLPLASFIFTGTAVTEQIFKGGQYAGASATGAAIGGGLVTVISGFFGFFLGGIFLIIGLLVGREKQVIIVQQPQPDKTKDETKPDIKLPPQDHSGRYIIPES